MKKDMCFVSVIIPCYNAANKIKRCLNALENQTCRDFEVVLVNDSSTDDTYSYLENYKISSSLKIQIVNLKQNQGPGVARNIGLSFAKGSYVCFCDSDDWYKKNFILKMTEAVKENIDIAMCNIILVKSNNTKIRYTKVTADIVKSKEDLIAFNDGSLCNLIIKRELFDAIKLPELYNGEDMAIVPVLFSAAQSYRYIDEDLYCYFVNKESLSNTVGKKDCQNLITAFEYLCREMDKQFIGELEFLYIKMILYGYTLNALKANMKIDEIKNTLAPFDARFLNWPNNRYINRIDRKKQIYLWMIKNQVWVGNRIYAKLHEVWIKG